MSDERDMTPALGSPGGPASWVRAVAGAPVALHRRGFADARWSNIFRRDSRYAGAEADPEAVAAAAIRARDGEVPAPELVNGPMMKAPVWTWEVPLYFWFGGMAAGSTFVAFACDLAGDARSARIARRVALAALMPSPPLLIADLGRPERFHHMLRVFKPRSPMSMGSWCLSAFGALAAAAVGGDLLEYRRTARVIGAVNVPVAAYLGSYTGVLLAVTNVPLWNRSDWLLGPIFVTTATLTGAGAVRLTLAAAGRGPEHPTAVALRRVEHAALATELLLSELNAERLGELAQALDKGAGGRWFARARGCARAGVALRLARRRFSGRPAAFADHLASGCFIATALCFRYGWVRAGADNARDDVAVARAMRSRP